MASPFDFLQPALKIARKHLPEIAIWTGTVLEGAAVIFGIRETPRAIDVLNQRKPETFAQKAEILVPSYWKTITCFTLGTLLILTGNHLHLERTAIALGIAATQRDKLAAMTEETKKLLGPKKSQELEEKMAADQVDVKKIEGQKPVYLDGDQTFVCAWNNFAFHSTVEKVNAIAKDLMNETMTCKHIDEDDVDEMFGCPQVNSRREHKGWNIDHPPKLRIASWMDGPDGKPMGVLTIVPEPQPGWVLDSGYLF